MTNYRSRLFVTFLAALAALLGVAPAVAAAQSVQSVQSSLLAECGDTSGFRTTPLAELPPEAGETYELIQDGGPYPYPQDGTVFQNRERLLPLCSSGYYHEYTVDTPGSSDRGARRIVTGEGGEHFYTADHYASFVLIGSSGGAPEPACGDGSGLTGVALSELSAQAQEVVREARAGATGAVYENREGVLPQCPAGYYRLFEVGADDRVITGDGGEVYYTPDHYDTFQRVDVSA